MPHDIHDAISRASLEFSLTVSSRWHQSHNLMWSFSPRHILMYGQISQSNRESVYFLLLNLFNIRHDETRVKKHRDSYCMLSFDEELNWVLFFLFFFSLPCKGCDGSLQTYQHMHFSFSPPRHIAEVGLGLQ